MATEVKIAEANSTLIFRNAIENKHKKVFEIARKNTIEIMLSISSWIDNPCVTEHSKMVTHSRLGELQ